MEMLFWQNTDIDMSFYWNFSKLAALEVVILTTFSAANDKSEWVSDLV